MIKYLKPEFMLTSLTADTTSAMSCSLTPADRQKFDAILGNGWETSAFGSTEVECEDNSIDNYCKFTSGTSTNSNIKQVFVS